MHEYIALVSHSGPGGMKAKGDDAWRMSVDLVAYIKDNGPIVKETTILFKEVPYAVLKEIQKLINEYTIIRFTGVAESYSPHRAGIHLTQLLESNVADSRFDEILADLKKPIVYTSGRLGVLTLARRHDWFEGTVQWGHEEVGITLGVEDETALDPGEAEAVAIALLENQAAWDQKVRDYAVSRLLSTRNHFWLDPGETPETAKSFKQKLQLASIAIEAMDGEFTFWFNDGGLFAGHSITVTGNLTEGIGDAQITG